VSEFHSIGGCSFCPIDIPFRMDDDLFGSGTQVNPSDPSRSNGRVLGHGVRYRIRRRHVHGTTRLPPHNFHHWRNLAPSDRAKAHLAHDGSPRHFVRQEMARPVAAAPTGHGARHSYGRLYIQISIWLPVCWSHGWCWHETVYAVQHCRKDPVSCALMSDLLMRTSSLAIMGVRLRARHRSVRRARSTQAL